MCLENIHLNYQNLAWIDCGRSEDRSNTLLRLFLSSAQIKLQLLWGFLGKVYNSAHVGASNVNRMVHVNAHHGQIN